MPSDLNGAGTGEDEIVSRINGMNAGMKCSPTTVLSPTKVVVTNVRFWHDYEKFTPEAESESAKPFWRAIPKGRYVLHCGAEKRLIIVSFCKLFGRNFAHYLA